MTVVDWEWPDPGEDAVAAAVDDSDTAIATVTAPPALYFADLEAFVTEFLAQMYRRSLSATSLTWCPTWWKHAEAIARLEALWRSWEHLRLDPATGMSVWLRDHCDPHMAVLLSADGPFKGCSPDKGHGERLAALPLDPAPAGFFSAVALPAA